MRIAAELEGGLTRVNLMVALRNLEMTAPFLQEGLSFRMHGAEDPFLVEGGQPLRFDAATGTFQPVGEALDVSGRSPTCAWDPKEQVCR